MKASVIYNRQLSGGYYRMRLRCPEVASEAWPGSFLTIRISDLYEPLLRRPFTIYGFDPEEGTVDVVYKVVGVGTLLMSEVGEGAMMDLLGPLGNGFGIPSEPAKFLLVAGGTGIAALHAFAQHVSDTESGAEIALLMGGKKAEDIICVDDFEELGASVLVATEDGSLGMEGRVTDLLENQLAGPFDGADVALYSCGPREMLKEVARLARLYSLPCAVSLEERMGCGLGACLGCVIRVLPGSTGASGPRITSYKRICRDGPVFDATEIDWEAI